MTIEKDKEIMNAIYTELYANAEPPRLWYGMVESGETKNYGFWNNYYLDDAKQLKIINKVLDKFKLREYKRQAFINSILLGSAPTGHKSNEVR